MKPFFTVGFVSSLTVLLLSTVCSALDKPRRRVDGDVGGTADLKQNAAILQENIKRSNIQIPSSNCTVCDATDGKDTDRIISKVLSNARGLLHRTSTFRGLSRATRTRMGRRRYEKVVSTDLIVPALTATSSHFAALALQSGKLQKATTTVAPPIETDLLAVLEQVFTVSANVANELASVIRSADKVTAGLVATSTLALLGFFERVTVATTSLLFDHVAALNGQDDVGTLLDIKVSDLQVSLSNGTDRVFGDVLGFLSTRRDTSGLVPALTKLTKDMALLNESLARFLSRADTMRLTQRSGSSAADRVSPDESLWQLSGIMTGTVMTVVHSMQSIVVGHSADDIGVNRVLVSALGLTMKRIDSILNQSVMTLNSMFQFQSTISNSAKLTINTTAVQGNTLLWFIACSVGIAIPGPLGFNSCWIILSAWLVLAVATLPIWLPLVILGSIFGGGQLRSNNAAVQTRIQCQREALSCQSNALSAALPSA